MTPAWRLVGPSGKVFATDLQPEMLPIIQDESRAAISSSNVEVVQGTETDARLPEGAIDFVLARRRLPRVSAPAGDAAKHPPVAEA